MADFLETAHQLLTAGLAVVPANGKHPALNTWKTYQKALPSANEVSEWFSNGRTTGLGLVCGEASGGLEPIDVDAKVDSTGQLNEQFRIAIQEDAPGVWERLVIEKTPSGGLHLFLRCPDRPANNRGNQKLACRPATASERTDNPKAGPRALIETRGDGGFIVTSPTPGYEILQGDLAAIPTLTPEERDALHTIARSLDQMPRMVMSDPRPPSGDPTYSPLDDFNTRGDVLALLERHGWEQVRTSGQQTYLRRPGKSFGHSATWNYEGSRRFVCFSTSTSFEVQPVTYSAAGVFAALECNGDFRETTRRLSREGFGSRDRVPAADPPACGVGGPDGNLPGASATAMCGVPEASDDELWAEIQSVRFQAAKQPPPLRVVYRLNGIDLCTGGNLEGIYAQKKSGKSAVEGAMIAAAMMKEGESGDTLGFEGRNTSGLALIHIDTEQSRQHWDRLLRVAMRRANLTVEPDWLYSISCASWPLGKVRRSLDLLLERTATIHGGVFAVLLDGSADFVRSVNDEVECNAFVAHLHHQAITFDCPIVGVLHYNPESERVRGHLGSQWQRKAESNLTLERSDDVTLIFGEHNRNAPISRGQGARFRWDVAAGMHVSVSTFRDLKLEAKRERLFELFCDILKPSVRMRRNELERAVLTSGKGGRKTTCERRVNEALEVGVLVKTGFGYYELAQDMVAPDAKAAS